MPNPIIAAARDVNAESFDTLRRVVDGLPVEALNWRPAGADTNSIAVLVTHAMLSTRSLLHLAAGLPLPARDRPAEFAAVADGPEDLLRLIDDLAADCDAALDTAGSVGWSDTRQRRRHDGSVNEVSVAYVLLHAVTHLRGHADEASLTRHAWKVRDGD
jgi:hypothetical protein